eukprot:CFRG3985T1
MMGNDEITNWFGIDDATTLISQLDETQANIQKNIEEYESKTVSLSNEIDLIKMQIEKVQEASLLKDSRFASISLAELRKREIEISTLEKSNRDLRNELDLREATARESVKNFETDNKRPLNVERNMSAEQKQAVYTLNEVLTLENLRLSNANAELETLSPVNYPPSTKRRFHGVRKI